MRRIGRWIAGGLAATLLGGCGSAAETASPVTAGPAPTAEEPGALAVAAQRLPAAGGAPVSATVAGLDAFAARFAEAAQAPGQNLVFSPLSIAEAFAMLDVGAAGNTAKQIETTLGLPTGFATAFNALTSQLVTGDIAPPTSTPTPTPTPTGDTEPQRPVLTVTNGLFAKSGYAYQPAFLRTLVEQFGSHVQTLDFSNPQGAAAAINQWAAQHTAGRITKVFDQLDPATRLVLANAVYLKASWTKAFDDAGSQNFQVAGNPVQLPMISKSSNFGYATGSGWQAVTLPYFGGSLAMRVILPTGTNNPGDLLKPAVLAAAGVTKPTAVNVTMPQWQFDSAPDLKALMEKLGVTDCFDPARANLSGVSTEGLYVDQAIHRATISVDRYGTEAAAVTALSVVPLSGVVSPTPPVNFTVDRPFLFEIVDTKTSAPLFLGTVADPRAH